MEDIDALDRNVSVREVFTEHKVWSSRWFSWQRPADEDYQRELCAEVYGKRDLPPLDVYVSQISGLDRILIRICLALNPANGAEIEMLVMDDLEQVRELEDRMILLEILERLSHKMPVIINAVNPLPEEMALPHTRIDLFTDASHLQPKHKGLPHFFEHATEKHAPRNRQHKSAATDQSAER